MAKHTHRSPAVVWVPRIIAALALALVGLAAWGVVKFFADGRTDGQDTQAGTTATGSAGGSSGLAGGSASSGESSAGASTGSAVGTAGDAAGGTGAAATTDSAASSGAAAGSAAKECRPVLVWAAPSVAPAVEAAAKRATGDCADFTVRVTGSGVAETSLTHNGQKPDVWVPDSAAWPELMQGESVDLAVGKTVASSPVVLVGHKATILGVATKIGLDNPSAMDFPTLMGAWATLQQQAMASAKDAKVNFLVGDPRTDPATMAFLSRAGTVADAATDPRTARLEALISQSGVPGDPMAALSDPRNIVPATEQQLAKAQSAQDPLAPLTVKGGLGVVHLPFVRVGGADSPAIDELESQLTGHEAATDLAKLGLRAGTDGAAPGVPGMPQGVAMDVEVAEGQAPEVAASWSRMSLTPRILTLIDVSGSMRKYATPTLRRIDLVRETALVALNSIPGRTEVGLWLFSTQIGENKEDWLRVAAPAPLDSTQYEGTQRDFLMKSVQALRPATMRTDTGLHDSIWAAVQYMRDTREPKTVSSVLVLTDGVNDDPPGGLSEKQLIDKLNAARETDPSKQVTLVLVGLSPEVDKGALQRIAKATGGESYVLEDPTMLPQVLLDIISKRGV